MTDYLERALRQQEERESAEEQAPSDVLNRKTLSALLRGGEGNRGTAEQRSEGVEREPRETGLWARWRKRLTGGVTRGRAHETAWETPYGEAEVLRGEAGDAAERDVLSQGAGRSLAEGDVPAVGAALAPVLAVETREWAKGAVLTDTEKVGVSAALSAGEMPLVAAGRVARSVPAGAGAERAALPDEGSAVRGREETPLWDGGFGVLSGRAETAGAVLRGSRAGVAGLLSQVKRAEQGYTYLHHGERGSGAAVRAAEEDRGSPLSLVGLDRAVERDARRYGGDLSLL